MENSESLEELDKKYQKLVSAIEDLYPKVQSSDTRAGQLASAYIFFETILCIGILHPSAVLRGKWWILLHLSSSITVAFWMAFLVTVRDSLSFRRQQDLFFIEQERVHRKISSIRSGHRKDEYRERLVKPFAMVHYQRCAFVGALSSSLLSVTVIVLYALIDVPKR